MTPKLVATSLLSLLVALPALANPDIEQSEAYRSQKAEIRYVDTGSTRLREVAVAGMRVDDGQLISLAGDDTLQRRLDDATFNRRLLWGGLASLGLPTGGFLVSQVSDQLHPKPGVTPHPGALLLGATGFILVMAGLAYGVGLLNDLAGFERPVVLNDHEASRLVDGYNDRLKQRLQREWSDMGLSGAR